MIWRTVSANEEVLWVSLVRRIAYIAYLTWSQLAELDMALFISFLNLQVRWALLSILLIKGGSVLAFLLCVCWPDLTSTPKPPFGMPGDPKLRVFSLLVKGFRGLFYQCEKNNNQMLPKCSLLALVARPIRMELSCNMKR